MTKDILVKFTNDDSSVMLYRLHAFETQEDWTCVLTDRQDKVVSEFRCDTNLEDIGKMALRDAKHDFIFVMGGLVTAEFSNGQA